MRQVRILLTLAAGVGACVLSGTGWGQASDPNPKFWASIVDPAPTVEGPATPLWNGLKKILVSARDGNATAFDQLLQPNAKSELFQGRDKIPFTSATVTAAMQSCLGPYLYDEGKTWVQFSWICHVDDDRPLSRIYTFRETSELAVTVWFEGSRIKLLQAMEPGWVPGARRVPLDAAKRMQAQ